MSRLGGNFAKKIFSGPAYDRYTSDLSGAELAPTTFDYNLAANEAAGNFIQDRIGETFGNNPISRGLGEIATYAAVPGAFLASPFHEAAQVIAEDKLKDYALPYSGDFANFTKAMLDQRVPQTMIERAGGVLQSTNLGQGIFDLAGKTQDIVSGIRQRNPGVTGTDYFGDVDISQPPGTDVGIMSNLANLFGSRAMADEPMNIEDFQVQNIEDRPIASVPSNFLNYRFQDARTPFTPIREGITTLRDQLGNLKNKGLDILGSGKDIALRGIGSIVAGPVGGFVGGLLGNLKDQFENRQLYAPVVDEFGNMYSAEELNKLNALGGYYTDPARSSRRRTARIANLLERQKLGKKFSQKNLNKLLAQKKAEEAAQQAAFNRLNEIRIQRDRDSMSGGVGETLGGTFGSSVNDPGSFSDYS